MVDKLGKLTLPSAQIILTCHGSEKAENNFKFFSDEMEIPRSSLVIQSFVTSPDCEFAVFAFMVRPQGEAHLSSV